MSAHDPCAERPALLGRTARSDLARLRDPRGFTLLEMLVAVGIAAILVSATIQVFQFLVVATTERVESNPRNRTTELVLDRMERELVGATIIARAEQEGAPDPDAPPPENPAEPQPWVFVGTDDGFGDSDADGLRFVTQSPSRASALSEITGFRLVSYTAREDDSGELALYRGESAFRTETERRPGRRATARDEIGGEPTVTGVGQFQLRYVDPESGETKDSWDSTSPTQRDQLPSALEITLRLDTRDAAGEPVAGTPFTRVVLLPVRPIGEDDETGEGALECTGPTVAECLSRIANLIESGGPGADEIEALAGRVTDSCFTRDGSPELLELAGVLGELAGADPFEVCQ